ncbi:hypothetical protein ACFQ58_01245 [Agromyces sp. NPDC056523]|uniref:hypothetical protein n=1 Tax=Agromyces sp. NPDC056523 TaxID=3345850 RepID=UPI00367232E3
MPFRSLRTIQSWLDEFDQLGYHFGGDLRVIQQDGADGADTGLVSVRLVNAATVITIQPEVLGAPSWKVTMEPRDETVTMDAPAVLNLAAELAVVSALCAFLQAKSLAFVGVDSA